jgi:hypothetical protein
MNCLRPLVGSLSKVLLAFLLHRNQRAPNVVRVEAEPWTRAVSQARATKTSGVGVDPAAIDGEAARNLSGIYKRLGNSMNLGRRLHAV